jgi:hypothetical protein
MLAQEPKGPFCQSCGMPMESPEDFGRGQNGFRVDHFCRYCFANGAFTEPDISMEAMLDKCASVMAQKGIHGSASGRALMAGVLPRLKRWRTPPGASR